MKITDNQIDRLDSLLTEGIVSLSSLPKERKEYINKVKNEIKVFCTENDEPFPDWVDLSIPTIFIGNDERTKQSEKNYYQDLLPHFLNMLRELQNQYYSRMQLEEYRKQTLESSRQTVEAQSQTKEAQKANMWTVMALAISGFAVVVSIAAVCLSTGTRTIRVDETPRSRVLYYSSKVALANAIYYSG